MERPASGLVSREDSGAAAAGSAGAWPRDVRPRQPTLAWSSAGAPVRGTSE